MTIYRVISERREDRKINHTYRGSRRKGVSDVTPLHVDGSAIRAGYIKLKNEEILEKFPHIRRLEVLVEEWQKNLKEQMEESQKN